MGSTLMRALVKVKEEHGLSLERVPVPEPGEREVLVRVKAAAICGSDIKLYKWTPWCRNVVKSLPFIPGHEGAGEVAATGSGVRKFRVGDRVAAETHIPCGRCWQCGHGRPHTCLEMGLFGHTVNGCFAEYFTIPDTALWKLSDGISLERGCLLEPMGIPLRAVYGGEVAGDSIAVVGCGPIGQFAVGTAKVRGAHPIVALDINEKRLAIAERMGASHLINPEKEPVRERILALTGGNGAGTVIEASGSAAALRDAFDYVRIGGTLYTIGHPGEEVCLDVSTKVNLREVRIIGLFGRELWKTWEIADDLIASGKVDPDPIVTHTFSFEKYEQAFEAAITGAGCKIVLTP
jgi:threonine 3-dehydrogenase